MPLACTARKRRRTSDEAAPSAADVDIREVTNAKSNMRRNPVAAAVAPLADTTNSVGAFSIGAAPAGAAGARKRGPAKRRILPQLGQKVNTARSFNKDPNNDHVKVAVRCRPLLQTEIDAGEEPLVEISDGTQVLCCEPGKRFNDYLRLERSRDKEFHFDFAYDGAASQEDVYRDTVHELIPSVIDGYSLTVFCYGATGSGKTYTMFGDTPETGILGLSIRELYSNFPTDSETKVMMWFVEVYNETLRDCLSPENSENLDLREDPVRGVVVANVTEVEVATYEDAIAAVRDGMERRTTAATDCNDQSSRSHAVIQFALERRDKSGEESTITSAKVSFIDLAGSERASRTDNRGTRLREGCNINRSLLALANCINALGDASKKGSYVPYRGSKLTRLLKDSLSGLCKTVMICTVSPNGAAHEETLNTLKYASRAKNITVRAKSNRKDVGKQQRYQRMIREMRREIADMKNDTRDSPTSTKRKRVTLPRGFKKRSSTAVQTDLQRTNDLKKRLRDNFDERIQIKRSIMEIEETNAENQRELAAQEQRNVAEEELTVLRRNIDENSTQCDELQTRLRELEVANAKLREEIKSIQKQDRKDMIEQLIQTQALEISNMELDLLLKARSGTVKELVSLVEAQRDILQTFLPDTSLIPVAFNEDDCDVDNLPALTHQANKIRDLTRRVTRSRAARAPAPVPVAMTTDA